ALRTAASRVDAEVLALTRSPGRGRVQDRLMVCLTDAPSAKALVRAGRRMTDRARIPWFVTHVVTPRTEASAADAKRGAMADALALAERLGAETRTLRTESDPAGAFLDAARTLRATRLIVGRRSVQGPLAALRARLATTVEDQILDRARDYEVTVLTPTEESRSERAPPTALPRRGVARRWMHILSESLTAAVAGTALAWPFWYALPVASLAAVYLVGVLAVGMRQGTLGAMVASLTSFLAYNFFFTQPYYSFEVSAWESLATLVVFVISALFTGTLAGRLKRQVEFMRATQTRTDTLYDFARKIASATTTDDVFWAAAAHIAHTLTCDSLILMPVDSGGLQQVQGFPSIVEDLDATSAAAALWAFEKGTIAGAGTDTLPLAPWMFLPLATHGAPIGVIGVRFLDTARRLDPDTRRLLTAVEDQVAVAVERIKTEDDLERARLTSETEKLRAALLNSVSHDLRTPLVTVIGALSAVKDGGLSATQERELMHQALDEARRLDRFVGNLLGMTRLGHGALVPRRMTVEVGDLIGQVRSDLARVLAPFRLDIHIAPACPDLLVDPVLVGQALANLLENATKYAAEGSLVRIDANPTAGGVALTVSDEGPGIPPAERARVFDLFRRAVQGDGQPAGTGLGLAIVKGMVDANGGTVAAIAPPQGRGAAIRMILPAATPEAAPHG
ncbi:MAG: DUF4118 domain-containing protein, partial [Rhodobacteraceae bacterium]|nr:DUF4118 domain-containing protein [Paracoccaceae bacterium]